MSDFPRSPKLLRGGLVLLDADDPGTPPRVLVLQYNPDSLSRTLQVQGAPPDAAGHNEVLRLKGPPVETIKLDCEIDATDQLEHPDQNQPTAQFGLHPQLAALEMLVYPSSAALMQNKALGDQGVLEILPASGPLTLFVWSASRVVPVRITDFSITEEAFDPSLNPIRAKVSLGMRVLSVNDFGFDGKGASVYLIYQQAKERLAGLNLPAVIGQLGLGGVP
jgi:hypothetical protein